MQLLNPNDQTHTRPHLLGALLAAALAIFGLLTAGPSGRLPAAFGQGANPVNCFGASNRPGTGVLLAWHLPGDVTVESTRLDRSQEGGLFRSFAELPVPPPPPQSQPDGDGQRFTTVDSNVADGTLYTYRLVITETGVISGTGPFTATYESFESWRFESREDAPQDEARCSQERTSPTWTATPDNPLATPTPTWTLIPTKTNTPPHTATGTWTPTSTHTPTPTWTNTAAPFPTQTPLPSPTGTPSLTPTPFPPTPTETPTPTITPTPTPLISAPNGGQPDPFGDQPPAGDSPENTSPQPTPVPTDTPTATDTPLVIAPQLLGPSATPTPTEPPAQESPAAPRGELTGPAQTPSPAAVAAEMGVPAGDEPASEPLVEEESVAPGLAEYAPNPLPRPRRSLYRLALFAVGSVAFLAAFAFIVGALSLFPTRRR